MKNISRHTFQSGAQIFREGEPGNSAYIIESGAVTVTSFKNGRPFVIGVLKAGDIFGEMALIDDEMRSATVTANQITEVICIPREYVKDKLTKSDPLAQLFLDVVLKKFRNTQHRFLESISSDVASAPAVRVDRSQRDRQVIGDIRFEHELQEAVNRHELQMSFQPIVPLRNDQRMPLGFEALARWNHPQRGLLQPQDFVHTAEGSGLIVRLGREVLRQSCQALGQMQQQTNRPLYMCVNVSPHEIGASDFVANFIGTIKDAGLDPVCIKMEITEHALLPDPDGAAIALEEITAAGVQLAIDDFGTGFSSFTYLCRFPIDTLKIDRSFIATMLDSERTMEIVQALITLAQSLNMHVIAEGVESQQQFESLCAAGCDYGQGFYFASPLDLSAACNYVREYGNS